MGKHQVHIVNF
jgi:hypothetical protein